MYSPDAAFTRMCLYAVVGAFTPKWVRIRERYSMAVQVRIHRWVHIYICVRVSTQVSAYKFTPDRVNAGIDEP